jgi:hypothetical protein
MIGDGASMPALLEKARGASACDGSQMNAAKIFSTKIF